MFNFFNKNLIKTSENGEKNKRGIQVKGGRAKFNCWERKVTKRALYLYDFEVDYEDKDVWENTLFPVFSETTWRKNYKEGLSVDKMANKVHAAMVERFWVY